MTFDPVRILQSKREYRERAAARPIREKLGMLDVLREGALAIGHMNAKETNSKEKVVGISNGAI